MKLSVSLLVLAAAVATTNVAPAAVLNHAARIIVAETSPTISRADTDEPPYVPLIIEISDNSAVASLEALGTVVYRRRDNLLLASVPRTRLSELEGIATVTAASAGITVSTCLDRALLVTGVPQVHSGTGSISGYTGRGVVVGFSDIGFDPGHAVFSGRVGGICHYNPSEASVARALSGPEIAAWTTDDPGNYHATHVGGILAGDGDGSVYRGVAPGATIFPTTSQLDEVGILLGVEDVMEYARRKGARAVVNLSLGSPIGPHDGTDLFCRYLDLCAASEPVVLSAGNDGNSSLSVSETFTDTRLSVTATVSESVRWDYIDLNGYIDAWSADERPFALRFRVYDLDTQSFVYRSEPVGDATKVIDCATDPLGQYFDGQIITAGGVSDANLRYNLIARVSVHCRENRKIGPWARYCLCVELSGEEGVHVDMCGDGRVAFKPVNGTGHLFTAGNNDMSISSMSCGYNTITVGSATSRDVTPLLSGGEKSWTRYVTAGTVSAFSSYGVTADGRMLPHFCAPGAYVVSAVSSYYLNSNPAAMAERSAEGSTQGNYFIAECGTSMAAPHAAGIFALWLEADPTLTPSELRRIAMATASTTGLDPADRRSGAGMIDAAAGLRMVLDGASIDSTETPPDDDPATYYDLIGRPVGCPTLPGVYVRRTSSSATRVLIK